MVFDWFKRNLAPLARPDPDPVPAAELVEEPADAAETATPPPAVDQDALAWARQAYLRLKAEQEAQSTPEPPSQPPQSEPAPEPAVALGGATAAAEPPAAESPAAPLWTATVAAETPTPVPPPVTAPHVPEVPPAPPEAQTPPAPAGPSLLELAAAQRRQRLEEITAPASPNAAVAPSPAAPAAASSPAPVREKEAEPELGAFDDTFTWSAEVLAAQGRRVEEVSLEEIDWLGRLRQGLEKTRRGFVTQLLERLGDDPLTPEVLDDLESTLLGADVGVQATDQVLDALRQRLNEEVVDPAEGIRFLKEQLRGLLEEPITASGRSLLAPERERLNVWLMVGVNGVGKTTTLGKLANLAVRSGYSALIAAADTFRAAAVQQVRVWGERSGVPVIANPSANADPAAVVFDAIGAARAQGTELVLVDTAGRLQTKHNLMEELAKVRRIVDKLAPEAAVESLLILAASQGQNGLRQAMAFAGAAGLTGVVITKLDGSARGGVAIAVAHEAGLPIRFIGAGEGIRDLRPFNSYEFVEALLAS
ncbi:MAG: signal recognition particle-docking protein FtsY [Cyanobacteriota bacterium]